MRVRVAESCRFLLLDVAESGETELALATPPADDGDLPGGRVRIAGVLAKDVHCLCRVAGQCAVFVAQPHLSGDWRGIHARSKAPTADSKSGL